MFGRERGFSETDARYGRLLRGGAPHGAPNSWTLGGSLIGRELLVRKTILQLFCYAHGLYSVNLTSAI